MAGVKAKKNKTKAPVEFRHSGCTCASGCIGQHSHCDKPSWLMLSMKVSYEETKTGRLFTCQRQKPLS